MRLLLVLPLLLYSADQGIAVHPGEGGVAEITLANGKVIRIPKESGQVGIDSAVRADDGTSAGWLVLYDNPGVSYPTAGTLIVWRAGKIVRRFNTEQAFYSWSFYAGGKQVAFHTGPLHFEQSSHCELHDIANGRLIASWDGDLVSAKRPVWTEGLDH